MTERIVGAIGRVSGDILPGKPGEVMLPFKGGVSAFLAVGENAHDTIRKGERVIVMDTLPGRTVVVAAVVDIL